MHPFLLLALSLAQAPPPPVPPPTPWVTLAVAPKARPGGLIIVKADWAGQEPYWEIPDGLTEIKPQDLGMPPGGPAKARLFTAEADGVYVFSAYNATDKGVCGKRVTACVTVGTPAPKPPPTPPPDPKDAFQTELGALARAASIDDRALLPKLAALYRQGVALARGTDPALGQVADPAALAAKMHAAADGLLGTAAALKTLRDRVLAELRKITANGDLPADWRARAADVYGRAAAAVEDAGK